MKNSQLFSVFAASFVILNMYSSIAKAVAVSGQGTWESTLYARDFDGDLTTIEAYYDTVLDITWSANPKYSGTTMGWVAANNWAASLDIEGITGWRLPTMVDTNNLGCDLTTTSSSDDCGYNVLTTSGSTIYSEMASLFYDTLGNLAYRDTLDNVQAGWGLSNTGPFSLNPESVYNIYWTANENAHDTVQAFYFDYWNGWQGTNGKTVGRDAWAVHDGDVGAVVSTVPLPSAVWLFSSALLSLFSLARRSV